MSADPYARFRGSELILRDELAVDRTALANERTLLAYVRTALALAITGAGVVKFFEPFPALLVGWCLFSGAALAAGFGVWRFRRVARRISAVRRGAEPSGRPG